MQVVQALDFNRGSYKAVFHTKNNDINSDTSMDIISQQQLIPWNFYFQVGALLLIQLCIEIFMRLDNFYEWNVTPKENLFDAATLLFPHLSNSSSHVLSASAFVENRADIKSFGFDLGGSTCACTLQWDTTQYWQRVIYGTKYVSGHVFTAFFGMLLIRRWEWVLLFKFMNESVEELTLPIFGLWAAKHPIMEVEPRYNSLVNDTVLAAFPFVALCCHFVYAIDLDANLKYGTTYDLESFKKLFTVFLQYYVVNNTNNVWNKFGGHTIEIAGMSADTGKVFACVMQLVVLRAIWVMRAWNLSKYWMTIACLVFIWCPFIFNSPDSPANEQISAALSFALPGLVISVYQYSYTQKKSKLLALAAVVYICVLILYFVLAHTSKPFIQAPNDEFYYKRKWCGLGGGGRQDSCSYIKYN